MNGEYKMSELQGQQKEGCLKKIIDFLNGLLPWLRFGINLGFYIAFIWVIIHAGNKLWINTLPKEPKAIKELIEAIKENAKPVSTQRHSKEKTKVEQEFKDSSPSFYRNPVWFPSLDSAKTTIETSKAEDVPESYTIRIDDFENALKAVALTSRQEAVEDYHKSFSILVAILAVFGIGFPIIVALVQHSFNDRDLEKIENTATKADEAIKQVISIKTEANKATEIALKGANEATSAIKDATNAIANADGAAQKADGATQKADDAANKAKNAVKNINEVNSEMHNEMFLICIGLSKLFEIQSDKISQSLFQGQSLVHGLKYFANIDNIAFTNSKLSQNAIRKVTDKLNLIDVFFTNIDTSLNDMDENLLPKELLENIEIVCNHIINILNIFYKKMEKIEKEEHEIESLKATLIDKKEKIEKLQSEINKRIQ